MTGVGARPTVRILGTHGIPAAYGGFETAAENVAVHLRDRGWRPLVYCQLQGDGPITTDVWNGIERVNIPEPREGWRGTSSFDLRSVRHALSDHCDGEAWLTFGYNTGILATLPRLRRIPHIINMDGMEWTRRRWGLAKQSLLLANERAAGWLGDVLVADHPEIARYLRRHFGRRRVQTITYGAHAVTSAATAPLAELGLTPGRYGIVVCRPIPENSVKEIVEAWSQRRRGMPLVVVGPFDDVDAYRREVRAAASAEVIFPGSIFDPGRLQALRFHAAVYLHGHTVGGTNPSLVESLAAGNAVIAHRNIYNTWVAGPENRYFTGPSDLSETLTTLLPDDQLRQHMGAASRERHRREFTWQHIGTRYERALAIALDREDLLSSEQGVLS